MRKLREKIIALKQRGISATRISKLLKVPKSTVFDAIKRFQELADSDCSGRGRKKSVRTKKLIKNLYFYSKHPN